MIRAILPALVAPVFLFLALVLGGSTRGVWGNMGLQLLGVALLAWAALTTREAQWSRGARPLGWILIGALCLILLQLIPLPPAGWANLPGREPVAAGYALLGEEQPWLPMSLNPYGTLASALFFVPPVAIGALLLLRPQRDSWLAAALLAGACAGVVLGALQAASAGPGKSDLYLYEITNSGSVGFFANRNHMGTLLLVSLPFAFALLGRRARTDATPSGSAGPVLAAILVLVAGILLNRSTAVLILGLPVMGLSLLLLPIAGKWRRLIAFGALLLASLSLLILFAAPATRAEVGEVSLQSRLEIWRSSVPVLKEVLPWGSGLGSFEHVVHLHEDVTKTTRTFINHAHNDYLELAIELGVPGILLLLAFLLSWGQQARLIWKNPASGRIARAATIASAAILAQSLVDYPLRTLSIACVFAMSLAIMARAPLRPDSSANSGRPRHVVIG